MEDDQKLTSEEEKRLDELLSAARRFHYISFVLAAMTFLISTIDSDVSFKLPLGGVEVPKVQTVIGLYFIVAFFTIASNKMFFMAEPWLKFDGRRLPFAWIALKKKDADFYQINRWLFIPTLLSSFSTVVVLSKYNFDGVVLFFFAATSVTIYSTYRKYVELIRSRKDERGGGATFSIFLLYLHRLLRSIISIIAFLVIILNSVPSWNIFESKLSASKFFAYYSIFILLRLIGSFTYKWLDKLGSRLGFPAKSEHY